MRTHCFNANSEGDSDALQQSDAIFRKTITGGGGGGIPLVLSPALKDPDLEDSNCKINMKVLQK